MQHQHHCTHARITKQLFAGLAQGQFDYSAEIPIGGELQLVGIALIPSSNDRQCCLTHGMKQRSPTNAILCTLRLYTRLLMCNLVIWCTKLTWMYILRRRYAYFSLSLSFLLHPGCCNYSTALFIMVLILMILMVYAYYSIVNPPARITSSCIWRVTTSPTGRRTRPRIDAPEQRYSPVSISIRKEKNVRGLQTRG